MNLGWQGAETTGQNGSAQGADEPKRCLMETNTTKASSFVCGPMILKVARLHREGAVSDYGARPSAWG